MILPLSPAVKLSVSFMRFYIKILQDLLRIYRGNGVYSERGGMKGGKG